MDTKAELEQEISEAIDNLPAKKKEKEKKDNPVKEYLKEHTHPSRNKDDLLDVRIGNPLKRITEILEDIKKQKAFSFTLRGSLGIMGVALALSTFGILGGSKILCDKGTQSYIGTVKQLNYTPEDPLPLLTQLTDAYNILIGGRPHEKPSTRLLLIQQDNQAINLVISRALDRGGPIPQWLEDILSSRSNDLSPKFVATGQYDSCSRTLKLKNPSGIEPLN